MNTVNRKRAFVAAAIVVMGLFGGLLCGCSAQKNNAEHRDKNEISEEEVMLLNYYRATNAAVDGDEYYEIAVYSCDVADCVKLCVYEKEEGGGEICTEYIVADTVVSKCMALTEKYNLSEWENSKNATSADGALVVVKYKDGDKYVRVSTEHMPQNGMEILQEIANAISAYIPN